jgi:hypothetical protein
VTLIERLAPQFVERHWRRAPLYTKGGAGEILPEPMPAARFLAASAELGSRRPELVFGDDGRVVFAQKLDLADAMLGGLTRRAASEVTGVSVWFDGVWAADGEGIGSHYDIADSIILQQSGTKVWRLHPPARIPRDEIRSRVLNETRVDAMHMPDGFSEFVLGPGDLLYIPMLWLHWGVSVGESVSVSLAFTSRNALQWLPAAVASALDRSQLNGDSGNGDPLDLLRVSGPRSRFREVLWAGLYASPDHFEESARKPAGLDVAEVISRLSVRLREHPDWWRPVPAIWRNGDGPDGRHQARAHFRRLFAALDRFGHGDAAAGPGRSAAADALDASVRRAPPAALYSVGAESVNWVSWLEKLEAGALPDALSLLDNHVAGLQAQRMVLAARRAYKLLPASPLVSGALNVLTEMARLDRDALARMATSPELSSFTWRLACALEHGYRPRIVELMDCFPGLVAPYLEGHASGLGLAAGRAAAPAKGPDGKAFQGMAPPHSAPGAWSRWLEDSWPADPLAQGLSVSRTLDGDVGSEMVAAVRRVLDGERGVAAAARASGIRVLGLRGSGRPHVSSLPWYRGLVLLPGHAPGRWPDAIAREAVRAMAYDLIDVAPVFWPSRRPGRAYPFLEAGKESPLGLFHAWFVAADRDPATSDADARREDLLRSLHATAGLTDWGRHLVNAWARGRRAVAGSSLSGKGSRG